MTQTQSYDQEYSRNSPADKMHYPDPFGKEAISPNEVQVEVQHDHGRPERHGMETKVEKTALSSACNVVVLIRRNSRCKFEIAEIWHTLSDEERNEPEEHSTEEEIYLKGRISLVGRFWSECDDQQPQNQKDARDVSNNRQLGVEVVKVLCFVEIA